MWWLFLEDTQRKRCRIICLTGCSSAVECCFWEADVVGSIPIIPMKMKKYWRLWCLALGEKASDCNKESDVVAIIRTLIFISYLLTNVFIVSGVIRHWDKCPVPETRNASTRIDRSFCSTRRLCSASIVGWKTIVLSSFTTSRIRIITSHGWWVLGWAGNELKMKLKNVFLCVVTVTG